MSQLFTQVPKMSRQIRRPQHTFNLKHRPYVLQPCLLAPVIPGETMKSMLMQSRVVSDPIANPLIGWWIEYYFFYVKHNDLHEREELQQMMLNPNWDSSPLVEANPDPAYYFAGGGINWAKLCMRRVVEEYFRDEGDAWDAYTLDGLPIASIQKNSWMDSILPASAYQAVDLDVDRDSDGTITASEVDETMRMYQMQRQYGITEMSYEQWLATYGIRPRAEETHVPELLRFVKDWSYPTNTVDPATGVPSSAVSWAVAERADKDRFFREPGFIFGLTVSRPKVYLSGQRGSAAWHMRDAFSWLPAVAHDPAISIRPFAEGAGPLGGLDIDDGGYWIDIRDLLIYGDQFVSSILDTDKNLMALPTGTLDWRYPAEASIEALFKDAEASSIRQDGICNLQIASHNARDTTPRGQGQYFV